MLKMVLVLFENITLCVCECVCVEDSARIVLSENIILCVCVSLVSGNQFIINVIIIVMSVRRMGQRLMKDVGL